MKRIRLSEKAHREQLSPFRSSINECSAAAKSLQSCPTLRDPMDCSLPGSSVHGIFQARGLEWGTVNECSTHVQIESVKSVLH